MLVDDEKRTLEAKNKKINDIFEEVESYCMRIETQYEIEGKSIEPWWIRSLELFARYMLDLPQVRVLYLFLQIKVKLLDVFGAKAIQTLLCKWKHSFTTRINWTFSKWNTTSVAHVNVKKPKRTKYAHYLYSNVVS